MTDATSDIRIDDLGAPVLTPMQKMVIDGFAGVEVEFTEDAVLGEAQERMRTRISGRWDRCDSSATWCGTRPTDCVFTT